MYIDYVDTSVPFLPIVVFLCKPIAYGGQDYSCYVPYANSGTSYAMLPSTATLALSHSNEVGHLRIALS